MNDDFLHRLRKEPRPQFAARLRTRLQRQAMSPPPARVPSRARTLLTLLLLGGTAFAVTAVAMRGPPPSLVVLYQDALTWISAGHTISPARQAGNERMREGLRWSASGSSSSPGAALHADGTTQSAPPAMSARSAPSSSPGSGGSPMSGGGTPPGPGAAQISVVASWSAYPYATTLADQVNSTTHAPHIDVSVRDSDVWPGPMCGGAHAPDMAYAFEQAESERPCPHDDSGNASRVIATRVGYEIVVLARSPISGELDLTRRQIFLALARWVPDPARPGTVQENRATTWLQIGAAQEPEPIAFIGPPLASPAGHSMVEVLMESGCNTYPWIAALQRTDPHRYNRICRTVRSDGVYAEVATLSASALLVDPNIVGILSIRAVFMPQSGNKLALDGLAVSKLDGIEPSQQSIRSGAYPGSRSLYLFTRGRVAPDVLIRLLDAEALPHPDWALDFPPLPELRAVYQRALNP